MQTIHFLLLKKLKIPKVPSSVGWRADATAVACEGANTHTGLVAELGTFGIFLF